MIHDPVRILVLRGGAIGDFLVTLPVFEALRGQWPQAHIELISYPRIAELALSGGAADAFRSLDEAGIARLFSFKAELDREQEDYFKSFDLVISYLHDPDGLVKSNLTVCGVKQIICGSPMVAEGHAADHLLKPLEELAIFARGAVPRLAVAEAHRQAGREWLQQQGLTGKVCALHPGSGSPSKNWPLERFLKLAKAIPSHTGWTPFFILGEADVEIINQLQSETCPVPLLTGASLSTVAGVLSHVALYIGNDSGITHLAAALHIPVFALFGVSDPESWGPRAANTRIVCNPSRRLSDIQVEDIQNLLTEIK